MSIHYPLGQEIGVADWPNSQPKLKEDAIRYASVLLNAEEIDLPMTPDSDEVETRLVDETKRMIADASSRTSHDQGELDEVLSQIEMRTDAPEGALKSLLSDVAEQHRHHSNVAKDLETSERQAKVALTAEATRHGITRGPKRTTTSAIVGYAIGFAGVEALVTAASFLGQTGASGAAGAVGLALTAACTNIGLGGYLCGTVLIPRSLRQNSSAWTAWLYRALLTASITWLIAVNVLLGHFRAASGDFGVALSQFLANPLNVGDMTGLLLVGFGFILSAIWCLKFYASQDPYLEYGALGEDLESCRQSIADNRNAYIEGVQNRADEARGELDEAEEDAIAGHQVAREIRSRTAELNRRFSNDQDEILLKATETAMYRRSIIREMLSPHGRVPEYIAEPIDLTNLRRSTAGVDAQLAAETRTESQKDEVSVACTNARKDVESIVAQALAIPFGASIYPTSMLGGSYVEQKSA